MLVGRFLGGWGWWGDLRMANVKSYVHLASRSGPEYRVMGFRYPVVLVQPASHRQRLDVGLEELSLARPKEPKFHSVRQLDLTGHSPR